MFFSYTRPSKKFWTLHSGHEVGSIDHPFGEAAVVVVLKDVERGCVVSGGSHVFVFAIQD